MKRNYLTEALFMALLLSASTAGAGTAYPEATEPEVLFQNDDYISESSGGQTANVEEDTDESSDSNYPPTDAKAEVLYQDSDYIKNNKGRTVAKKSIASSSSSSSSTSRSDSAEASASSSASEADSGEGSGMLNYLVGLLALAGVGFYLKQQADSADGSKPAKRKAAKRRKAAAVAVKKGPSGTTGVGKYLQDKGMGVATGVAKYVEAQEADAATGVEKYLKNKG